MRPFIVFDGAQPGGVGDSMRQVWLNKDDFEMFHQDISPLDYEFFRTHVDTFKRMWKEQVRERGRGREGEREGEREREREREGGGGRERVKISVL